MALSRVCMQSSASPMDSRFSRPVDRTQIMHVGSIISSLLEKVMSEPTLIEYADINYAKTKTKTASPHWLSPNYIDLHLRSARLVSCEAKSALHRHFVQPRKKKTGGEWQEDAAEIRHRPMLDDSHESLRANWNMLADNPSFLEESFC